MHPRRGALILMPSKGRAGGGPALPIRHACPESPAGVRVIPFGKM